MEATGSNEMLVNSFLWSVVTIVSMMMVNGMYAFLYLWQYDNVVANKKFQIQSDCTQEQISRQWSVKFVYESSHLVMDTIFHDGLKMRNVRNKSIDHKCVEKQLWTCLLLTCKRPTSLNLLNRPATCIYIAMRLKWKNVCCVD